MLEAGVRVFWTSSEGEWTIIRVEDKRGDLRSGYVETRVLQRETPPPMSAPTETVQPLRETSSTPLARPPQATAFSESSNVTEHSTGAPRGAGAAPVKADSSAKAVVLHASIVDRRTSDTSYNYVAPATITSTSQLYSSCSGQATSYTPYSTSIHIGCSGSGRSDTVINPSREYGYSVTGATFALRLRDGRHVIVNCQSKYALKLDYINRRSCRIPLVDDLSVEFDGDKAKLFWSTSLDGRKIQSETYKILAVFEPHTRQPDAP
jgi:hypothetical protein